MGGKINIKNIIKKSLQLVWKNKSLALISILTLIFAPIGEIEAIIVQSLGLGENGAIAEFFQILFGSNLFTAEGLNNLGAIIAKQPLQFLVLLLILIFIALIAVFFIWLSVIFHAAIILKISFSSENKIIQLKKLLGYGIKKFWPIFTLDLALKAILVFLFYLLGLSINYNYILFILLFICFSLVTVTCSALTKFTAIAILLENLPLIPALKTSLTLLKKNWASVLKLILSLFVIDFLLGITFIVIKYILDLIVANFIAASAWLGSASGLIFSVKLFFILTIFIGILIFSIFAAIHWTAWNLLFRETKKSD